MSLGQAGLLCCGPSEVGNLQSVFQEEILCLLAAAITVMSRLMGFTLPDSCPIFRHQYKVMA